MFFGGGCLILSDHFWVQVSLRASNFSYCVLAMARHWQLSSMKEKSKQVVGRLWGFEESVIECSRRRAWTVSQRRSVLIPEILIFSEHDGLNWPPHLSEKRRNNFCHAPLLHQKQIRIKFGTDPPPVKKNLWADARESRFWLIEHLDCGHRLKFITSKQVEFERTEF